MKRYQCPTCKRNYKGKITSSYVCVCLTTITPEHELVENDPMNNHVATDGFPNLINDKLVEE